MPFEVDVKWVVCKDQRHSINGSPRSDPLSEHQEGRWFLPYVDPVEAKSTDNHSSNINNKIKFKFKSIFKYSTQVIILELGRGTSGLPGTSR